MADPVFGVGSHSDYFLLCPPLPSPRILLIALGIHRQSGEISPLWLATLMPSIILISLGHVLSRIHSFCELEHRHIEEPSFCQLHVSP